MTKSRSSARRWGLVSSGRVVRCSISKLAIATLVIVALILVALVCCSTRSSSAR